MPRIENNFETFKGSKHHPYDLTIYITEKNGTNKKGKINLEIKIRNNVIFKTFKENFINLLNPHNHQNSHNIRNLELLFNNLERQISFGKEYIKNNQIILFEFNLDGDNSKVTINNSSIDIKTKFKHVLYNMYKINCFMHEGFCNKILENRPQNKGIFKITNVLSRMGETIQNKPKNMSIYNGSRWKERPVSLF